MTETDTRPIDRRFVPPVAGIDLEQALNYIELEFVLERDEIPVRASRIYHDADSRAFFEPLYGDLCRRLRAELGPPMDQDFAMAAAGNPLDGFTDIGYHNYYAHGA